MSGRFVSIGEIMVELAPAGDGHLAMGFAGDTFNTAWYARRLLPEAWRVDYVTALGTDALSDDVLGFIAAEGIGTDHIQRRTDRTVGLYMIRLSGGERSFSYWRGQSAARLMAEDVAALARAVEGADLIWLSGITLAILGDAGRTRLLEVLANARAAGARVALDTNIRRALWPSENEMRRALTEAAGVADIVLPSFDEEEAAFGDADPDATIARYREGGAGTVVVKNGAGACHGWSAEEGHVTVTPPRVAQVVDSTAAGDSFGAGFLAARAGGADLRRAIEAAAALSARVIGHRGALAPQIFDKGEAT